MSRRSDGAIRPEGTPMILAQQTSSGGSPITLILLLALPVVLYLMMRSQRRKMSQQQAVQRGAEIGDEIMTTSGIFGTIVDEDDDRDTVEVEIAPGTRITMIRGGIARIVSEDEDDEDRDDDDDVVELDDADDASADADNADGPFRS
jgi:preprotein translocase subunit YajC